MVCALQTSVPKGPWEETPMKRILMYVFALMLMSTVGYSQSEKSKSKAKGHEAHSADAAAVKDAIKKMEAEMREASLKGDASAQEKYLADDYHVISGANGQAYDKKQAMERLKSGATKFTQINISNDDVVMYDHDMAVSHGVADVKVTTDGKDSSAKYHYARTWMKRNGKWQAVWFQNTKMQ
jgi:uncharacterized protein (TIGR02246 family)